VILLVHDLEATIFVVKQSRRTYLTASRADSGPSISAVQVHPFLELFSPAFNKYFSTFRMAALRLSPLRLTSKSASTSVTVKRAAVNQARALSSLSPSHRIGLSSSCPPLKSELFAGSSPLHHSSSQMSNYSSASATARLSTIARHLKSSSELPLNTPYSSAQRAIQAPAGPQQSLDGSSFSTRAPTKPQNPMSSQAPHAAVLIPGPIEYDDAVLQSMSHYR